MRFIYIAFVLLLSACTHSKTIIGTYNRSSESIDLFSDLTFKYVWHYHLYTRWAKGTWNLKDDTINLTKVSIYDTASYLSVSHINRIDTLILSTDEVPERYVSLERLTGFLSSYTQDGDFPKKLYYSSGKLLIVKDGKILPKKAPGINGKKYKTWYGRT